MLQFISEDDPIFVSKLKNINMKMENRIREVVKIDESLCDGCGLCVPNCHEGALQIIDDKARLVSDLMCDGLGACIGHCPQGAISIEKREAEPYDETKVISLMAEKGKNTVIAHLKHLKEHGETAFLKEGVAYLKSNSNKLIFDLQEVINEVHGNSSGLHIMNSGHTHGAGCPGSQARSFTSVADTPGDQSAAEQPSALRQWPVQMHLINPNASYFQHADLVLAADCVAYSLGNFHSVYLKGKSLAIACPKLDSNMEVYLQKLQVLIDDAKINTLQVMIMEVPCCGGLVRLAQAALQQAQRKVPVKVTVVGIQGEILKDEWM